MATTNLPVNIFRLATLRAPRKPLVADTTLHTVPYALESTLHQTLATQRVGANARATMKATATTYKGTGAYISAVSDLYALFPGFPLVDDYLRTERKEAVKADLKALVESPTVLNKTAAAYVGAGGYAALKSKVWDNLMALSILGENVLLRTEHTRILRLLNIINEGKYIQFFEQAFEWEQISYYFYPYFWARKREWVNILQRDESDPLFMNFLQAGAARVLVPVRPGYEKAMLHYLNTGGEIWQGEDVPAPDDPLYVSIIDEIKEADGSFEGGEEEGEPWLSKVPTSLVYLEHQGSPNDLPDYSADLPL